MVWAALPTTSGGVWRRAPLGAGQPCRGEGVRCSAGACCRYRRAIVCGRYCWRLQGAGVLACTMCTMCTMAARGGPACAGMRQQQSPVASTRRLVRSTRGGQIAFLGLPIWANAGSREHWVCLVGLPFCPALRACMRASDTLQQASRASAGAVWLRPWCLGLCRVLPCRVPPSPAIKGPASAGAVMFFLFFFLRSGLLALAGSQPNRFSPRFPPHCFLPLIQRSLPLAKEPTAGGSHAGGDHTPPPAPPPVSATCPLHLTTQSQSFLIPYKHAYRKQTPHKQQLPDFPGPAASLENARRSTPANRPRCLHHGSSVPRSSHDLTHPASTDQNTERIRHVSAVFQLFPFPTMVPLVCSACEPAPSEIVGYERSSNMQLLDFHTSRSLSGAVSAGFIPVYSSRQMCTIYSYVI